MKATTAVLNAAEDKADVRYTLTLFGAIAALTGGFLTLFIALLLIVISYLESLDLARVNTLSIVASLALLFTGACLMDRVDDLRKGRAKGDR